MTPARIKTLTTPALLARCADQANAESPGQALSGPEPVVAGAGPVLPNGPRSTRRSFRRAPSPVVI